MRSEPSPSGRRRLAFGVGAVAFVGFASGIGIAALTSGSDDDADVAAQVGSTTTTAPSTPRSSWSLVPTTSTTEATTSTTAPTTTTTAASSSSTSPTSTTSVAPPPTSIVVTTTRAPLPEPWPVPTSVPSSSPGTPANLRVAYPGQGSGGVLRLRLGQDSQMVVSNAGGTQVLWQAVASGGIGIGGQQVVDVVLAPGQSAALPLRTLRSGPAAITVTSPTQRLVVPVEIT